MTFDVQGDRTRHPRYGGCSLSRGRHNNKGEEAAILRLQMSERACLDETCIQMWHQNGHKNSHSLSKDPAHHGCTNFKVAHPHKTRSCIFWQPLAAL